MLTNFYATLRDSGVIANGKEDSDINGYQFLEAIKKLSNVLNDIEQVLSLTGTEWSVNINIDNLPNKYVFVARVSNGYNSGVEYTFRGIGEKVYSLRSSTGFNSSDTVLVTIDKEGVRVISLSKSGKISENNMFTVFGTPLLYNDSDIIYYEEEGNLISDIPSIVNLQQSIRLTQGTGSIQVYNILVIKGNVLCFCCSIESMEYFFCQFAINDLQAPFKVTVLGLEMPIGVDKNPYVYADGSDIYLTNAGGVNDNDYEIAKLTFDSNKKTLTYSSTLRIEKGFKKTTNAAVHNKHLITFVSGSLLKYNLYTGSVTDLGYYNTLLGVLFKHKEDLYYTNGEVAKKWVL